MSYLSSLLWLVPLLAHGAFALATYPHMPPVLRGGGEQATSTVLFYVAWTAIILLANGAFLLLMKRLPKMRDAALNVPGQKYWLSTPSLREELIDRLRGICEAALLGLNVFFVAIYQMIYQTNAIQPVLTMPLPNLVLFFMVGPLVVVVAFMAITLRGLARGAK